MNNEECAETTRSKFDAEREKGLHRSSVVTDLTCSAWLSR
ncbi:hypothetical protein LG3211_0403 [Lysobacter gummosus]|nr:hypothetical protein LG3211_0403 [Lysobacter gummosus]